MWPPRKAAYHLGVRRALVAIGCVGLAIAGTQAAHAVAYRLVEPSAEERAHLLAGTGHGYLEHASLALALVVVAAVLALVVEVRIATRDDAAPRIPLWVFGLAAPATFVVQEHIERWIHDGGFPWGAALHGTFLVGLALQLPFALAAYLFARLVLGVTQALIQRLRRERPRAVRLRSTWPSIGVSRPLSALLQIGLGPRGPPLASV
jgi:hypothetical protein